MSCWDTLTSNRRRRLTLVTALSVATFPEEREAKRQALLDKVESLRDIIASGEGEAEDIGTLPQGTVDAIHERVFLHISQQRYWAGLRRTL